MAHLQCAVEHHHVVLRPGLRQALEGGEHLRRGEVLHEHGVRLVHVKTQVEPLRMCRGGAAQGVRERWRPTSCATLLAACMSPALA